jgi:DNA-binding transcriptional LysR family regulator
MLNSLQDKDIKLLRMFYVIAKHGSFAAAQIELNLSQSAISTQMAQLETRLGFRLCERGHGNFIITNRGTKVLKASKELFSSLEGFISNIEEYDGEIRGEFRIGLIDNSITIPNSRILDAISEFTNDAPNINIKPYIGHAIELETRVIDDRLHCAVGLFYHQIESLKYYPLFDEKHLLYCSNSNKLFDIEDKSISNNLLMETPYVSWDHAEKFKRWKSPFKFNISTSSPYMEGVAYLILSGKYIGYLPAHYAESWVKKNMLRPIKPKLTSRNMKFSLIRRKSLHVSRLMNIFLNTLNL